MWFKELTGFSENSPYQVRENLILDGENLISKATGKCFSCGSLSIPSLGELRGELQSRSFPSGKISLNEIIADVQELHKDKENTGSLFQVASQFNLLEMVSPEVSPDSGVDGYEYDHTQGPACSIAAGAGTLFRNYFATVNGQIGQSSDNQIDTLVDLGEALGNSDNSLWVMKNGYALASKSGLETISKTLSDSNESEVDELRQLLRIGLQHDTEVTISTSRHKVSQAYCSALPIAYSQYSAELWKPFAELVLEASYEATICAAIINSAKPTGNNKVFLTLLGGGAFGNDLVWIINAIERAVMRYRNYKLDVFVVSYRASNSHLHDLINRFNMQ